MEDLNNESYERGTKRAEFNVAARYYKMGLISIEKAAEDAGMQLEEFAIEAAKISSYVNTSGPSNSWCRYIR